MILGSNLLVRTSDAKSWMAKADWISLSTINLEKKKSLKSRVKSSKSNIPKHFQ